MHDFSMADTFNDQEDMFAGTIGHDPAPTPTAPRMPQEPVVAALKDDDYSLVKERAVFRKDVGSLGMSVSRSRTSGHLVVVNAAAGGEARSLGLTVGCAVVELNTESLGVDLSDSDFAALLVALERPLILGFRRPKQQEEEMRLIKAEELKQKEIDSQPKPRRQSRAGLAAPPVPVCFDHSFPAGPLGMNLMVTEKGLVVKSVDDNGSASKGNILPGVRIVAVQGEPLPDVPQNKLQAAFVSRLMAVPRPVTMTLESVSGPPSKKKPPPPPPKLKPGAGVAPPPTVSYIYHDMPLSL